MKNVVVEGFSYSVVSNNPSIPVSASVSLTGLPSLKCKAGGKGVCKNGFTVSVYGISAPVAGASTPDPVFSTPATGFPAAFSSTATKTTDDGTLVLLAGDKTGNISASPLIPGSPPVAFPVSFYIEISAAGQTKVKGS